MTFFASAQRQITVVQLEASTGSTSSTHQNVAHVYSGDIDFDPTYSSEYRVSSTTTYSLSLNPNVFLFDGKTYRVSIDFLQHVQSTFSGLGRYGTFLLPDLGIVPIDDVLERDPHHVLEDAGWIPATGQSEDRTWRFYPPNCDVHYEATISQGGYGVTEFRNGGFTIIFPLGELPDGWRGIPTSNYESIQHGILFVNLNEIIEAVNNLVAADTTCEEPEPECTNTVAMGGDMNTLIVAANPDFVSGGQGVWIDRVRRPGSIFLENRWNRIEIDETNNVFILEIGAGGDGHVGARTPYTCLEELLENLPNE